MSVVKDELVKRVQEIDQAINDGKKVLEEQCAHLNVLDGQRREALHWLYKVENPVAEVTPDVNFVDPNSDVHLGEPLTNFADHDVSPDTKISEVA